MIWDLICPHHQDSKCKHLTVNIDWHSPIDILSVFKQVDPELTWNAWNFTCQRRHKMFEFSRSASRHVCVTDAYCRYLHYFSQFYFDSMRMCSLQHSIQTDYTSFTLQDSRICTLIFFYKLVFIHFSTTHNWRYSNDHIWCNLPSFMTLRCIVWMNEHQHQSTTA